MKSEIGCKTNNQTSLADWSKGASLMLFFAAAAACLLDVFAVTPGELSVPFWGYIGVITTAVALQFVGSAFSKRSGSCELPQHQPAKKKRPFVIK